jgi:molybdopterin-guanine dinucleotide biosynthesis protein B
MKIFGFAGWSGSGKTTLMTALIPELVARGVSVSTVKHAHHAFDVDQPGKDSWRHRAAGAVEVMVASERRWALPVLPLGDPPAVACFILAHLGLGRWRN